MKEKTIYMTSGRILPQLILFALPLLGSSLIQQLYNTADLLFIGNFAGKTSAAAVGSSGLIFTCLIGLFTGISTGTGIIISHLWGSGKKDEAAQYGNISMVIGTIGSFILMIIGLLGAKMILEFLQTPAEVLEEAVIYIRIYFLSMIPMIIYNMGSSIVMACGDSKMPFYILILGGITNIIADTIFVAVLRYGVAGAAVATSISQSVSAVCMIIYLLNKNAPIAIFKRKEKLKFSIIKEILRYGLPAGIQAIVLTLSNVVVQYYINGYGQDAVASYSAYFKIESILYLPILACGQAVTTFVGQNYGIKSFERIKNGTIQGILISCVITIFIAQIVLIAPETAVELFLKDNEVIRYGVEILKTTFPLYWLYAVLVVMGGAIRGMGYSLTSMFMTMFGLCGFRVSLLYFISHLQLDFSAVAKVYPITWAVTSMGFIIIFCIVMMKKGKEINNN